MSQKHYSFHGLPDIHRIVRENPDARAIYVAAKHDAILLVRHAPELEAETRQVCHRVLQRHGGHEEVSNLVTVRHIAMDGRPDLIFSLGYDPDLNFLPTGWLAVKGEQIDRPDHPAIRQIIAEVRQIPVKPRVTVVAYTEADHACHS